jgi:hypothetical protein
MSARRSRLSSPTGAPGAPTDVALSNRDIYVLATPMGA